MRIILENLDKMAPRTGLRCVWEPVRQGEGIRLVARWIARDHDESQAHEERDDVSCEEESHNLVLVAS